MPAMKEGRPPSEAHEAAVSDTMKKPIGTTVEVGGRNLQIVGLVHDSTALAGQANVFPDRQRRPEAAVLRAVADLLDRRDRRPAAPAQRVSPGEPVRRHR